MSNIADTADYDELKEALAIQADLHGDDSVSIAFLADTYDIDEGTIHDVLPRLIEQGFATRDYDEVAPVPDAFWNEHVTDLATTYPSDMLRHMLAEVGQQEDTFHDDVGTTSLARMRDAKGYAKGREDWEQVRYWNRVISGWQRLQDGCAATEEALAQIEE